MSELIFPAADPPERPEKAEPSSRFVCFVLGEQSYGVGVDQVREVLRMTDIASVPGAPAACRGVINLRGQIVSVLDLRRMLGLSPAQETPQSRLLVVDHTEGTLALQVDRVMDLFTVADALIEPTPAVNADPVPVSGIVSRSSGPLFLLDPRQLITKTITQVAA